MRNKKLNDKSGGKTLIGIVRPISSRCWIQKALLQFEFLVGLSQGIC